jgi:hypothetical protein
MCNEYIFSSACCLWSGHWSTMFKKPVDVKTVQRLSGADKKKLRRTAKERFPQASDADLDAILPPKVTILFFLYTMFSTM